MSLEGTNSPRPSGSGDKTKDHGVLPVPVPFGKYYLLEKVATGGMAEVFKAKAFGVEGFERLLAVKRILGAIAEDTEFISMFIDEAKIAGRLNHANIAQIFDLGKADGSYFIAMEYISGLDCRGLFERYRRLGKKIGVDMACYIAMKVCEGLDYAHNKTDSLSNPLNIVHRDISPQNVLVSYEGEVKVIDFGIAKAAGKSTQTQVGILKGKFSYMSPEQVRGLTLDRRSDLFSLNIVLYELLTLERLFLGESDFETLEKIRKVEVAPPTLYNPHIPKELEDIVLRGLAKDPNQRYQTAHEMQQALQKFMFNQSLYFTNKDLASTLQEVADDELALERQKQEYYQTLDIETIRLQSGEVDGPAVQRGTGKGLDWDDDEIATTVYHSGHDDDLLEIDELELDDIDDWETSPETAPELVKPLPPPPPPLPANSTGSTDALRPVTGDGWDRIVAPVDADVTPDPEVKPAKRPSGIYAPPPRRSSRAGLWMALVLLLCAVGVAAFVLIPWGPNVEVLFEPTPSEVDILLNESIVHQGSTPFTFTDVDPGTYTVTISAPGYQPMTMNHTFENGQRYRIDWTLLPEAPPGLSVNSVPAGAHVLVDGQDSGLLTPATLTSLTRGGHEIRLERNGFLPATESVSLSDEPVTLEQTLLVAEFRALLQLEPADSAYILMERDTGLEVRTGAGSADLAGLDGSKHYLLIIEAPGHLRHSEVIAPSPEAVRSLQVRLEIDPNAEQGAVPPTSAEADPSGQTPGPDTPTEEPEPTTAEPEDERTPDQIAASEERRRAREERRRLQREADAAAQQDTPDEPDTPESDGPVVVETDEPVEQVASADPGRLSVQSRPSAGVFVDGQFIGYTPIQNFALPPGNYTVRLVREEFGLDYSRSVTIQAGEGERVIHRHD